MSTPNLLGSSRRPLVRSAAKPGARGEYSNKSRMRADPFWGVCRHGASAAGGCVLAAPHAPPLPPSGGSDAAGGGSTCPLRTGVWGGGVVAKDPAADTRRGRHAAAARTTGGGGATRAQGGRPPICRLQHTAASTSALVAWQPHHAPGGGAIRAAKPVPVGHRPSFPAAPDTRTHRVCGAVCWGLQTRERGNSNSRQVTLSEGPRPDLVLFFFLRRWRHRLVGC